MQVDSMTEENDDTIIVIPTQPISNSRCSRKNSCNGCLSGGDCAWVDVKGDGMSGRCYDSCDEPNYPTDTLWICWDGALNTPEVACSSEAAETVQTEQITNLMYYNCN